MSQSSNLSARFKLFKEPEVQSLSLLEVMSAPCDPVCARVHAGRGTDGTEHLATWWSLLKCLDWPTATGSSV